MSIAENVARIRAEMEAAALACGRDPKEIQLCAATKMNDADAVRQAIAAGVDCCGENGSRSSPQSCPRTPTRALPSISSAICRPTRSGRWWERCP